MSRRCRRGDTTRHLNCEKPLRIISRDIQENDRNICMLRHVAPGRASNYLRHDFRRSWRGESQERDAARMAKAFFLTFRRYQWRENAYRAVYNNSAYRCTFDLTFPSADWNDVRVLFARNPTSEIFEAFSPICVLGIYEFVRFCVNLAFDAIANTWENHECYVRN